MALPALATSADLEARLGRALTTDEATRAAKLLTDASAMVRTHTHQDITRSTTTQRVKQIAVPELVGSVCWPGFLRLPQRPVNSIVSVTDIDGNVLISGTDYRWVGGQKVAIFYPSYVDVSYNHGLDSLNDDRGVLDAVAGIVCQIVGRALGRPADETALSQETVDGYSYTVGAAASAGPFGVLDDEKAALDSLLGRVKATSMRLA